MRLGSGEGLWKEKRLHTSSAFCPQRPLAKNVPSLALGHCISEPEPMGLLAAIVSTSRVWQGVSGCEPKRNFVCVCVACTHAYQEAKRPLI